MPRQKTLEIAILPVAWKLTGTAQRTTKYQAHCRDTHCRIYGDPKATPSAALVSLREAITQYTALAATARERIDDEEYCRQLIEEAKRKDPDKPEDEQ